MPQSKRHPARRPAARSPRRPHPPATSRTTRPSGTPTAAPSGARATLERISAPVLRRLALLPRWVVPLVLALFLVGGLILVARWAAVLLLVVGLFLGWLLALSWPALPPRGRLLRVGVVTLVLAATVAKALGVF